MIFVYIGIYLLILTLVWGFFIVAKIHAYKFKNFSNHLGGVTIALQLFLAFLSILGFVLLFFLDSPRTTIQLQDTSNLEENYY